MDASDVRAYIERWEAVEKIRREELQSATIAENWRRLNAIRQIADRLGITRGKNDDGEMEVYLLWARLKEKHASTS